MLTKVSQRLWTGWGGFDRIQAYDEYGTKLSVLDGSWVIELLSGGLPRFIGVFGLLTWPIFKAARLVRKLPNGDRKQLLSGLALVASFVVLDLVPNSFFNYLSALICGVVLGLCRITDEVSSAHSYARTSHPALPSRSALPDHT